MHFIGANADQHDETRQLTTYACLSRMIMRRAVTHACNHMTASRLGIFFVGLIFMTHANLWYMACKIPPCIT